MNIRDKQQEIEALLRQTDDMEMIIDGLVEQLKAQAIGIGGTQGVYTM